MKRLALLLALLLVSACSSYVTVTHPPRVDLAALGTIGVIDFDVSETYPLRDEVTQRFLATLQGSQAGVRILELGSEAAVLKAVGHSGLDLEAVKAIGRKYGVDALLSGEMTVSGLQPGFNLDQVTLGNMSAQAKVNGQLRGKLRETASGATLWTNGAHGTWTIGSVSLAGGVASGGVSDPMEKYAAMLDNLVEVATQDFRSTYERRKVKD